MNRVPFPRPRILNFVTGEIELRINKQECKYAFPSVLDCEGKCLLHAPLL